MCCVQRYAFVLDYLRLSTPFNIIRVEYSAYVQLFRMCIAAIRQGFRNFAAAKRKWRGVVTLYLYRVSLHIIYIIGEYGSIADRTEL